MDKWGARMAPAKMAISYELTGRIFDFLKNLNGKNVHYFYLQLLKLVYLKLVQLFSYKAENWTAHILTINYLINKKTGQYIS